MSLRRALIGFVAAGCLFLLVEVMIEHREVFSEKPIAWTPIIVLALSLLACLWALAQWKPSALKAVQVVSVLLLLVGIGGLYFHNAGRLGLEQEEHEAEIHESAEHRERESEEHHAPPLAPLAISGMGVLGLMATYPKWQREEEV